MNKSTKIRYIIFQILIEIFKNNKNFNTIFNQKINKYNFNEKEISFINNVCLNSMRFSIHSKKILNKIVKKKLKTSQFILLMSALVQIVYLNIKPYAVVNDTVNVAKIIKVYPAFINAVLQNISKDIDNIKNTEIKLDDFPKWFKDEVKKNKSFDKKYFLKTFYLQPNLHIVFKTKKHLKEFKEPHIKSSKKSAFIKINKKISEIHNFKNGVWWIQDFSSMIPLAMNENIKNCEILDLCAAPGGKTFQVMSNNNNVVCNDINKYRIKKLKDNLIRLNFNPEIKNFNGLKFEDKRKFDIILIDSPCSAIGTVRKNPEIFFKSDKPNLKSLNKLQKGLLENSSKLLKKGGKIIYMVCSFFYIETLDPINDFLLKNKNFSILEFNNKSDLFKSKNYLSNKGYFLTAPSHYKDHLIDGFFAIQLKKNA